MLKTLHTLHLTHPIITFAVIMIGTFIGYQDYAVGAAVGGYWMREVRDCENSLGMNFDASLSELGFGKALRWAFRGWNLFNWTSDNHLDFWPVLFVAISFVMITK